MLQYYGALVSPPAQPVVSPNGDGVAERQTLSYKLVRPSLVTATLLAPDGSTAWTEQVERAPGRYPVAFPPPAAATPTPGRACRGRVAAEGRGRRRGGTDLDVDAALLA